MSVSDALAVDGELEALMAEELVAAIQRAAVEIVPKLVSQEDREWLLERLHSALFDGWRSTDAEWRRRYPRA